MADITAQRPASGAPIESGWGAEVHDQLEGMQSGTVNVVVSGATTGTAVVTFPRAYASPPRVFCTIQATAGSNSQTHAWIAGAGVTNTQASIAAGRDDATTFSGTLVVAWLAIGTPA